MSDYLVFAMPQIIKHNGHTSLMLTKKCVIFKCQTIYVSRFTKCKMSLSLSLFFSFLALRLIFCSFNANLLNARNCETLMEISLMK